ncbi:MAG TPA: flippase [Candidatus Limnocylindria bacterium]|nr:flippase [Candidatus Limnocylindria bacterium]
MTALRRILRDAAIVFGGQAVTWVATIIFVVAQARFLGPERFGELSLALSYAAFFAIVVDFGVGTYVTRAVAQREDAAGAIVWTAVATRAGLWLAALPVAWAITVVLGYEPELQATILILVDSLLFVGVVGTLSAFFQGRERFLMPTIANTIQRVVGAGIGIAVLAAGLGVVWVAAVYIASAAVAAAFLVLGLRGTGIVAPRFQPRPIAHLVGMTLPIGLYWIVGTFYFNVDMALIERLAPRESLGHYAAAYRLFVALTIVPAIVCGTILYPVYSRLSTESVQALRPAVEKTIGYLALAGVLVMVLCVTLASPIIAVLYPLPAYAPAVSALRLLAPGLLFLYLNSVLASALFALHRERRLLLIAALGAVLNTTANVLAIPVFGQEGAAAITSVTELVLLLALLVAAPRELVSAESGRSVMRAAVAGAVAAAVVLPLGDAPVILAGALGSIAFAAACVLLRAIPSDDAHEMLALLRGGVARFGLLRAG